VIVYCHSGRRAEIVGSEIVKKGFKVFNLGGFDAWKSGGLPTE
jgi:rhodanese-related sulfurtransferase